MLKCTVSDELFYSVHNHKPRTYEDTKTNKMSDRREELQGRAA